MEIICRKPYLMEGLKAAFPDAAVTDSFAAAEAEIIIADPMELTPKYLDALPKLTLAHCARAGFEKADTAYLKARGITLCNARGLYSVPIAEDILCKILVHTTNTWLYNDQKSRRVYRSTAERNCLPSLTVGFLGTGSIAQEAALRLKAFDCRVIGYKRSPTAALPGFDELHVGAEGLETVLAQSDIVVLTVDLNPGTYHLLNAGTIAQMKDGAAVINIARGDVVDERALIDALECGKVSYAGLDVFQSEPLPEDSPLWTMPQVTLTPHASGLCRENHATLELLVIENIRRYRSGEALKNQIF